MALAALGFLVMMVAVVGLLLGATHVLAVPPLLVFVLALVAFALVIAGVARGDR